MLMSDMLQQTDENKAREADCCSGLHVSRSAARSLPYRKLKMLDRSSSGSAIRHASMASVKRVELVCVVECLRKSDGLMYGARREAGFLACVVTTCSIGRRPATLHVTCVGIGRIVRYTADLIITVEGPRVDLKHWPTGESLLCFQMQLDASQFRA